MPVVHPAELWKESGRYAKIGPELVRFKDRGGRDMVLAMTHEEVVADLLRDIVKSYRQLPVIVYHFQTKFRDEPRARGGLIRVREFVMKDSYTLDADEAGAGPSLPAPLRGLRAASSPGWGCERSRSGRTSGSWAAAWPTSSWSSTSTARTRSSCATRAATRRTSRSRRVAKPRADRRGAAARPRRSRRRRPTRSPSLAALLGVGTDRTAKATFFVTGDGRLVTAIVRGDFEVNETKLANAVKAVGGLRPAPAEEITAAGMEPGYASPIGAHDTVGGGRRPGGALTEPGGRREPATASTCATSTSDATSRRTWWSTSPTPARATPARTAASRCAWPRASRSATSSSSAPTSPRSWARRTWPRTAAGSHVVMGSLRDRAGPRAGLHRRGPSRRQGHHLAARGGSLPAHLVALGADQGPGRGRGGRGPLPAPDRCRRGRAVRRPRRVARREADRCGAARHADHRHDLAALAGRGRRGSHRSRDRRARGAARSTRSRPSSAPIPERRSHDDAARPKHPRAFDVYTRHLLRPSAGRARDAGGRSWTHSRSGTSPTARACRRQGVLVANGPLARADRRARCAACRSSRCRSTRPRAGRRRSDGPRRTPAVPMMGARWWTAVRARPASGDRADRQRSCGKTSAPRRSSRRCRSRRGR